MAEIQADKDALRAEFAMSMRGLEITLDELKNKHSNALAELGRKGNAINLLKIEHEAQKVEFVALKAEVVTLTDQLTAAGKEIDAIKVECHADDLVFLVPKGWPAGKELLNHAADARDLDQRVELDGDRSDVGAKLQPAESSIRVSPSTGIRIPSNFVHLLMVGLVGFGAAFAWHQYRGEGAKELIRRVSSLGSFLLSQRQNRRWMSKSQPSKLVWPLSLRGPRMMRDFLNQNLSLLSHQPPPLPQFFLSRASSLPDNNSCPMNCRLTSKKPNSKHHLLLCKTERVRRR